jgi:hypothetical protein
MVTARIYQPSKTAMQSGKAKTKYWLLELNNCEDKFHDPLMGWVASKSTDHQVCLKFTTLEDALAHVKKLGVDFVVELTKTSPTIKPKSYADNFRYDKPLMFG